ncbi:MAG TPA: haloacid dehalogenase [Chloroflexota bacterium]|jgi:translin|nr:haloacid dehalogenase [Chloroflexota bacterium]
MTPLEEQIEAIRQHLVAKNKARESALALARETIRTAANAIRALHRHDFAAAEQLSGEAGRALGAASQALADHPDILHAGFIHDAAKEYAEARLTLALVRDEVLPSPAELSVDRVAFLHGLAESVGELRRHLLDYLRRGDVERCEPLLERMDEIYSQLVTIDFPDAMTAGLRRSTDSVRGILEKTRGDLTLAIRQRDLESRLADFEGRLGGA